jgi:hypothetical protein
LQKRADAIDRAHAKHWLGPLMQMVKGPLFDRGLLDVRYFTPAAFGKPETQRVLTEWLPRVGASKLVLDGKTKRVELVAKSPAMGLVPALAWWDTQMEDEGLKTLAKSPQTSHLTALGLGKLRATDAGLNALAKSPYFPSLRRLRLLAPVHGRNGITAKGVRELVASDQFPLLDTVVLTTMFNVKMPAFCQEPALARLKSLYLELVLESAGPVCRCPYLTGLEELTLDCIGSGVLTDADIGALLDNPALANLKRVTLHAAYKADQPGEAVVSRLRDRFGGNFSTEPRLHDD